MRYEILDILEFTSDRKRMSVIVWDCQSGKIFLLSKGADEAMLPCAYSGIASVSNNRICSLCFTCFKTYVLSYFVA
jgi:magnesium-transporting ATPase (P-type)